MWLGEPNDNETYRLMVGKRMRRTFLLMSSVALTLSLMSSNASGQVLGVEAASGLQRWMGAMRGV
ncbi:MAG: hypothetical protein VX938_10470, partial [Myxococcota bacterium]|nr:hypothetical protein [Myxococcota bacterium]